MLNLDPARLEAAARALCRAEKIDPDMIVGDKPAWQRTLYRVKVVLLAISETPAAQAEPDQLPPRSRPVDLDLLLTVAAANAKLEIRRWLTSVQPWHYKDVVDRVVYYGSEPAPPMTGSFLHQVEIELRRFGVPILPTVTQMEAVYYFRDQGLHPAEAVALALANRVSGRKPE